MKNKITLFWVLERKIWGDRVNANPYFATLSILAVALAGAISGGGRLFYEWFGWDMAMSNVAMAALIVWVWGYDVAESIVASQGWKPALGRSLLLLPILALAFAVGAVVSVVVICVIVVWLVLLFISYALESSGGRSGSRSSDDSGPDQFGYDGSAAHKLEKTGGGYARDDSGRRWKNDGGSKWRLDE